MPSKKSGGKRAVEKKHRERAAARKRKAASAAAKDVPTYHEQVEALGDPTDAKSAFKWMGRLAILTVKETALDPGLPPEQRRRDVMKQLEQASKICEPSKLSDELSELEEALEELRSTQHAGHVEEGASRSSSTSTDLLE